MSWTSDIAVSSGEFGVWARSATNSWYLEALVPASGGTSFATSLVLNVPADAGYQAIVAWRATPGSSSWMSWGDEPGELHGDAVDVTPRGASPARGCPPGATRGF